MRSPDLQSLSIPPILETMDPNGLAYPDFKHAFSHSSVPIEATALVDSAHWHFNPRFGLTREDLLSLVRVSSEPSRPFSDQTTWMLGRFREVGDEATFVAMKDKSGYIHCGTLSCKGLGFYPADPERYKGMAIANGRHTGITWASDACIDYDISNLLFDHEFRIAPTVALIKTHTSDYLRYLSTHCPSLLPAVQTVWDPEEMHLIGAIRLTEPFRRQYRQVSQVNYQTGQLIAHEAKLNGLNFWQRYRLPFSLFPSYLADGNQWETNIVAYFALFNSVRSLLGGRQMSLILPMWRKDIGWSGFLHDFDMVPEFYKTNLSSLPPNKETDIKSLFMETDSLLSALDHKAIITAAVEAVEEQFGYLNPPALSTYRWLASDYTS